MSLLVRRNPARGDEYTRNDYNANELVGEKKMENGVVWLLVGIAVFALVAAWDQVRRARQAKRDRQAPEVEKYIRR
jgi:hypothetical protein